MFLLSKGRREEIKQIQKVKKRLFIISMIFTVVMALIMTFFYNFHLCDDCGTAVFGKGYYKEHESQGVLGSVFGSIFGDTESISLETVDGVIICRECAMNNVSVKAELRDVNEFRR